MNRPTPAATRLRGHLAGIYGDRAKTAKLREQADTLDQLRNAGDEADRLLHESAMLRARIAASIRADTDSR